MALTWIRWILVIVLASAGATLAAATNDPVIHMLVPGFTVEELPVHLSNQNNLRFAPDGSLTALGYDGRIWRIRDTDGDGFEDRAEPYWDRPTLSVPLGMAWSSAGLYVSSKGKISLFRDTDGDGRADQEEIVVSGWPVTDVASGGVDATAVTLDREGNVYFGLLGSDYSNAYRLRRRGDLRPEDVDWLNRNGLWREPSGPEAANDEFSLYDLKSPRGTIQRWDPRTRKLETVATGLRVPVALAFNAEGDLFNTDQEGETWMPNGNPLDELNHIVQGRNFGFPPRHDRWLPGLESESPVVAFGPQHQSACGLVFNVQATKSGESSRGTAIPLPVSPGQGVFGPDWWRGDAFVAGESRGKIWRVRLVKTPAGYVGRAYTIARLSMLTLDLTISPRGDLYVCCHSGPPDWGTGPQGIGKIYRIRYTDRTVPQPVAVWPSGPSEVRVHFDRVVEGMGTNDLGSLGAKATSFSSAKIEFGTYVSAGDRFEVLKPPYEVVQQQEATPRGHLAVRSSRLDDGGATLVLTTDPHPLSVSYVLSVSGLPPKRRGDDSAGFEVEYDFHGVAARYRGGGHPWRGWLPYPNWSIGAEFLKPWTRLESGIRPPIPGNSAGEVVYETHLSANRSWAWQVTDGDLYWFQVAAATNAATTDIQLSVAERLNFDQKPKGILAFRLGWFGPFKAVSPETFWLPWAPTNRASAGTDSRAERKPEGDWEHGRELFVSAKINCVKCHRIRGEGGLAGPDLSNLIHRDPASVLRDIRDPGATLHPDYVTYRADLRDGETLVGFLRESSGDRIRLFDVDGKETTAPRTDVVNLHPTGQSLMPTGLLDGLGENDVRDLMTFLLQEPPTRRKEEVTAVLSKDSSGPHAGAVASPFRVVLVASKQDHGPGQHDYPAWQEKWMRLLNGASSNAVVEKAWEWPSSEQWTSANVVVFYFWNHDWSPSRYAELDAFQKRGGGLVLLHAAIIADQEPERLAERIGLSAQPGRTAYRHAPFELRMVGKEDPLIQGLPGSLPFLDEPYWPLVGNPAAVHVLASAPMDGAERPLVWTFERGPGRVFASVLGHYTWTLDDPWWRILCLRGLAWAGRRDPAMFNDAVLREAIVK